MSASVVPYTGKTFKIDNLPKTTVRDSPKLALYKELANLCEHREGKLVTFQSLSQGQSCVSRLAAMAAEGIPEVFEGRKYSVFNQKVAGKENNDRYIWFRPEGDEAY